MKTLWIGMMVAASAGSAAAQDGSGFTMGPAAGFLRTRDADDGTWFGGVQARVRPHPLYGAEASITFHQDRFTDGDVRITQYPVQVSGLFYPLAAGSAEPYVVAGAGVYYSRVDFSGTFAGIEADTASVFGGHVGIGIDLRVGPRMTLNADVRYIFINPDFEHTGDEDFDFIQIGLGLNIAG